MRTLRRCKLPSARKSVRCGCFLIWLRSTLIKAQCMCTRAGNFAHNITTFVVGYAIAFARSWQLSLVMLSVVPALAIAGTVFGTLAGKLSTKAADAYGIANSIVQQVCSGEAGTNTSKCELDCDFQHCSCTSDGRGLAGRLVSAGGRESSEAARVDSQALQNIRTVVAYAGEAQTCRQYDAALARPQKVPSAVPAELSSGGDDRL